MHTAGSVRPPRTLHLVDADNLLGDPRTCDRRLIVATFDMYRHAARFVEGDLVVVATGANADHVIEVEMAWPAACHRRRRGQNGADYQLLAEAVWVAETGRVGRVVIGSGDGIFIEAFDVLRAVDVRVEVVTRRRSLAACLALRARGAVTYLPELGGAAA